EPGASQTVRLWFGRVGEAVEEDRSGEPGKVAQPDCLPVLGREGFEYFDAVLRQSKREADEFYDELVPSCLSEEHRLIHRQALAGMLWTKQFYYYVIEDWLEGDPGQPPPPAERKT